jgi:AAA+ ATPase superfamily predicted ATPase
MNEIIGREKEKKILSRILALQEPEFLAIYGRRRVGKTFLIRNFFKNERIYFEVTGQYKTSYKQQLENFHNALLKTFQSTRPIPKPASWKEALSLLTFLIKTQVGKEKIILFFDELPWLATQRSGLLQAIDYEWNTEWSKVNNLKLIVCGSAASWVLDNIINATGGLHNRITNTIHLKHFSLGETDEYLKNRGIRLKPIQILELYMVMGGIPYYLNQIEKGKSATEIINTVCFTEDGLLFSEYDRLFRSLFKNADIHLKIIQKIVRKRNHILRQELINAGGFSSGGGLHDKIKELVSSGFIQEFVPFGKKSRDAVLKITDEYTLFFLEWIDPIKKRGPITNPNYWLNASTQQKYRTWTGYAFEAVCAKHVQQIIKRLGIENVAGEIGNWHFSPAAGSKKSGAQIDLIINRFDDCINICEIKFSKNKYAIDKKNARNLLNKINVFEERTGTKKQIFLTMITTMGLKKTMYSEDLVHSEVVMKDLFG